MTMCTPYFPAEEAADELRWDQRGEAGEPDPLEEGIEEEDSDV